MSIREKIPFMGGGNPYEDLISGLQQVKSDHDAVALLPYDDGTFFMKGASFDKDLIGGQGGYETEDGDKIVMDGDGQPVRELFGVPMLLGVDPTEHAAAVDPIKALVAQKNNIGEWIRVDSKGQVIQVGPALDPAPVLANADSVEDAYMSMDDDQLLTLYLDEYDPKEYTKREKLELVTENEADIEAMLEEQLAGESSVDVGENGMVGDGGMAGELARESESWPNQPTLTFDEALHQLAQNGGVTKVFDIAPPSGVYTNGDGEAKIEEATHIAVDQSKAADLLPTTTSTTELNTALDKARMEEHDEDKVKSLITYGIIIGAVMAGIFALLFAGMFAIL